MPKAGKLESLCDSETFAFTLSSTSFLHLENGRLRVSPRKRQEQGQGNAVDVTEKVAAGTGDRQTVGPAAWVRTSAPPSGGLWKNVR